MSVEVSYDALSPVVAMLDQMEENGTLRSRSASTRPEIRARWMAGKGAELAVTQFFDERYDTPCKIDTRAYDDVKADSGDIWKYQSDEGDWLEAEPVEIKKTGIRSGHVAITEAEARLVEDDEPIIYVKTDYDGSTWENPTFEVVGWCLKEDLHWVEQGEKPWTQNADNLCQPLDEMRTDWEELLSRIAPEASPEYQSPFTFSE